MLAAALRHALLPVLALSLAGCVSARPLAPSAEVKPIPGFAPCCVAAQQFPTWLVKLAEPVAETLAVAAPLMRTHNGVLLDEKAQQSILQVVRPLDVVLVGSRNSVSGDIFPGLLSHSAVYLGTEAQLRSLGVWDDPEVRPHWAEIRAGKTFIEGVSPRARLLSIEGLLHVDYALVLRPRLDGGLSRRRRAVDEFMAHIGTPFDFYFDVSESERLFCIELVCHVLPELHLPKRMFYGREAILIDEVAVQAIRGKLRLTFVRYLRPASDGFEIGSREQLRKDIIAEWTRMQRGKVAAAKAMP